MDIAERAYAAGLFDGEGCVQVYMGQGRTHNCFRTTLSLSGVDLRPLRWLRSRYGGKIDISATPGARPDGCNRRPIGRWQVMGREAEAFARDIRPFLIVKAEQLDLWTDARAMLRPRGYQHSGALTDDEYEQRREIVAKMKELKRS
jgi:hypothetical protein